MTQCKVSATTGCVEAGTGTRLLSIGTSAEGITPPLDGGNSVRPLAGHRRVP